MTSRRGISVGLAIWTTLSLGGGALAQPPVPPPAPDPAPTEPAPVTPSAVAPVPQVAPPTEPVPAPIAPAAGAPVAPTPVAVIAPSAPEPVAVEAAATKPLNLSPPMTDQWARPHFVKGELSNFAVRPMTRRNFVGVAGGISAIPNDAETILNNFFLTVEPQFDVSSPKYNWRLGLGAPLQFELLDTRGAFEACITEGRMARAAGGNEAAVSGATATCVAQQKNRATQNTGQLRRADWDEASDFARILRYAVVGGQEQPFYLSVSRLYDQTFGHGTVVRDYNPNIDYNTARLGATVDFNRAAIGIQAMANDLVRPDVLGLMMFVRPFRPYSDDVFWRSLSVGVSYVHGVNLPEQLRYEPGLFSPSFDQPIPRVDQNLNLMGHGYRQLDVIGGDVEAKLIRSNNADLKLYVDYQKMVGFGGGTTIGSLWRFSYGEPATRALRARAEVTYFDPDYMPSFFDAYHDVFQYQYLPAGYQGGNGLRYYPTKIAYLEANRGGRNRVGGYMELQHSFLNYLTFGVMARGWTPVGEPAQAGFKAPSFTDYDNRTCSDPDNDGVFTCTDQVSLAKEQRFASMRFNAELPLRRYLQAFASYEMFSTTSEKGLGLFKFDGDNEVFFSGARLMVLPIFFIQAEARRYFFLQRVNNVNLDALTLQQDQNYHANWTFALNASVGYEF